MPLSRRKLSHEDYNIGWIAALPLELAAAEAMLDTVHKKLQLSHASDDGNTYILGSIHGHNIVMTCLPKGRIGTTPAAVAVTQMLATFSSIRFVLMVGIGGGAPTEKNDIRLGDIVVSTPSDKYGGVIQYDFGKTLPGGKFEQTGCLNKPPRVLLTAVASLQAKYSTIGQSQNSNHIPWLHTKYPKLCPSNYGINEPDHLYESQFKHVGGDTCNSCDKTKLLIRKERGPSEPQVHYGLIASGNQVMRDAIQRDKLALGLNILCFEMEAAGLMDQVPCLAIRGICDYSDSHKNKQWQAYAAATAAAYAKELLQEVSVRETSTSSRIRDIETLSVAIMTMIVAVSVTSLLEINSSIVAYVGNSITLDGLSGISNQLSLLVGCLEAITAGCENGSITQEEQKKLRIVISDCLREVTTLEKLVKNIFPTSEDSKLHRMKKWISRRRKTKTVASSLSNLERYKTTLTLYLQQDTGAQVKTLAKSENRRNETIGKMQRSQIRIRSSQLLKATKDFSGTPHVAGTCEWIWSHTVFQKWIQLSPSPERLLCIQGVSGCGKSVLARSIRERFEKSKEQSHVLFFSFSGTRNDRRSLDSLIRTLLFQLLGKVSDEKEDEVVQQLENKISLEVPDLFENLLEISGLLNTTVYCIIDGVDECVDECNDPDSRLLEYVSQMVELENFRIVLLGRERVLKTVSLPSLKIEMDFNLIQTDIKIFTNHELNASSDFEDEGQRERISEVLIKESGGMFLWVKLMIVGLRKYETKEDLDARLKNLPKGMEKLYREHFKKLWANLDNSQLALARKVLAVTIASARNMTLEELRYFIALDTKSDSPIKDRLLRKPEQRILEACGDLVSVTNGRVQLIHFSVQEFLTRPKGEWLCDDDQKIEATFRVDVENMHLSLASICIDYLSNGDYEYPVYEPGEASDRQSTSPFLEYSSQNAIFHSIRSGNSIRPELSAKFDIFVESQKFIAWVEYLSMLLVESSYSSAHILDDIEVLGLWLEESGANAGSYERRLKTAFERDLNRRIQDSEKTNIQIERLQLIYDHIWNSMQSEDKNSGDVNLEIAPRNNTTPAEASAAAVSQIMNLINRNGVASMSSKLDLFLKLRTHLSQVKVICDPLKLLFEAILGMAEKIPAPVLIVIGNFYYNLNKFDQAVQVFRIALSKEGHVNGLLKMRVLNYIGCALSALDRQKDSVAAYTEALKESEQYQETRGSQLLGNEHSRLLFLIMNNLGLSFFSLREDLRAEEMFRGAMEGRQKLLGHEHPHTVDSIFLLGDTLFWQEKYLEAEETYKRAARSGKKASDQVPLDGSRIDFTHNLGLVFLDEGQGLKAEEMFRIAVERRQKYLGHEDLGTLHSVYGLALGLSRQERYLEAEPLLRSTMESQKKLVGTADPRTLYSIHALGCALLGQERYSEAREMLEIIMGVEELEHVLELHPTLLKGIKDLSYELQLDESEEHLETISTCSRHSSKGKTSCESEHETSEDPSL
ncbi:hypothetical protein TWF506_010750 [Arthrobotrys conoides]|uniref:NACHT domain-containing protein n=1 Tax=Arthrobotrys conoides TaxID=74498 RepID=A0AAN8NS51_9PEZI